MVVRTMVQAPRVGWWHVRLSGYRGGEEITVDKVVVVYCHDDGKRLTVLGNASEWAIEDVAEWIAPLPLELTQRVFQPPSVLVESTAAALRRPRGDYGEPQPHRQEGPEEREYEAIVTHLATEPPDFCTGWQPIGLRYEGDDAFLAQIWSGDPWDAHGNARHGGGDRLRSRAETRLARPEIWRIDPPWFVATRLPAFSRSRPVETFGGIAACGPYRGLPVPRPGVTETEPVTLIVRIVVPAAASDTARFRLRIAYTAFERSGFTACDVARHL